MLPKDNGHYYFPNCPPISLTASSYLTLNECSISSKSSVSHYPLSPSVVPFAYMVSLCQLLNLHLASYVISELHIQIFISLINILS